MGAGPRCSMLMVRLGEDPKGFPARWQAPACGPDAASRIASLIALWLTELPDVGSRVLDALVADLKTAPSFKAAERAALRFEDVGKLSGPLLDALADAYHSNDQIQGHIAGRVLKRIFDHHHRVWPPPERLA